MPIHVLFTYFSSRPTFQPTVSSVAKPVAHLLNTNASLVGKGAFLGVIWVWVVAVAFKPLGKDHGRFRTEVAAASFRHCICSNLPHGGTSHLQNLTAALRTFTLAFFNTILEQRGHDWFARVLPRCFVHVLCLCFCNGCFAVERLMEMIPDQAKLEVVRLFCRSAWHASGLAFGDTLRPEKLGIGSGLGITARRMRSVHGACFHQRTRLEQPA